MFGGVFAEVVDNGAGGGECLEMSIEAEAREFGDAELLPEDAVSVVVLEGPVVDATFDTPGAVEERVLGRFEKLGWAG